MASRRIPKGTHDKRRGQADATLRSKASRPQGVVGFVQGTGLIEKNPSLPASRMPEGIVPGGGLFLTVVVKYDNMDYMSIKR